MKKAVFLFLFTISLTCSAQSFMPSQSVGMTIMPDYGAGVIYSRYFGHMGVYASYDHTIMGFSSRRFDSSQKVSAGAILLLFSVETNYPFYLTGGMSYNTYSGVAPFYAKNPYTTQPLDGQVGFGLMIQLIDVGFRYDVCKNEAMVDFSVNFGKRIIKYKPLKHYRR